MKKLQIHTKRLIIRNLKISDLENFYLYRSNLKVCKYQGFDVMTKEETRTFIFKHNRKLFGKPNQWVQYGLELKETNELIGDCAIKISSLDYGTASIGLTITPSQQKKGLANEVLKGIMAFLFSDYNVHRIVENVSQDNLASINILKRNEFRKEGLFLEEHKIDGKWCNLVQYALLKKEWLKFK